MDWTLFVAWSWFQYLAIRLSLFLAFLVIGPSMLLILGDIIYYALRTTYDTVVPAKLDVSPKKETSKVEESTTEDVDVR
jgi:hypothetical protein